MMPHWVANAPASLSSPSSCFFRRRVLEGMDVVAAVAAVPTFAPSAATNARAWNKLAETLGDDRAAKARSSWSKPTQAIVIYDAGILE